VSTIVLSPSVLDAASISRVEAAIGKVPGARAVHLPGGLGTEEGITAALIDSDDATVDQLVRDYKFDISSIGDDRPFFWHFTPFSDALGGLASPVQDIDVELGIGEQVLLVLLLIAIVLAAVFLLGPLVVARETWRSLPHKATTAPIFAVLGLAFIAFEITLIQQFTLFLGYPTYSLTVTLMALLLSTGIGALVSPRWHAHADRLLVWLAAAIVLLGAFYAFVAPSVTEALLGWPVLAKAVVVVGLCAPLGFCLGMFMPLTISLVARQGQHTAEYVAWGWAINGFFSVIGSTLTTIVSMTYGFRIVLLSSVLLYLVAVVLLRRLMRRRSLPGPSPVLVPQLDVAV
jgi:hypothetical protein